MPPTGLADALPADEEIRVDPPAREAAPPASEAAAPAPPAELEPTLAAEEPGTDGAPTPSPAEPKRPARRAGMVPRAALEREKARRKAAVGRLHEVEAGRAQYEAELRQVREAERRRQVESETPFDYDRAPNLNEAFNHHGRVLRQAIKTVQDDYREDLNRARLEFSQEVMRIETRDLAEDLHYDAVIQRAGLIPRISTKSGPPADSYLHTKIFGSLHPARVAYEYALGVLEQAPGNGGAEREPVIDTPAPAPERTARDTLNRVLAAADRPRGISGLPGSASGSPTGGLTRAQIRAMSDEEKARLKHDRPDVWNRYLGGE